MWRDIAKPFIGSQYGIGRHPTDFRDQYLRENVTESIARGGVDRRGGSNTNRKARSLVHGTKCGGGTIAISYTIPASSPFSIGADYEIIEGIGRKA